MLSASLTAPEIARTIAPSTPIHVPGNIPMPDSPRFQQRAEQPYAAIRVRLPRKDIAKVVLPLWPEVYAWLAARGLEAAGARFIRYLVIARNATIDVEVGVPVSSEVDGDDRVRVGVIPAGRYVVLTHRGPYEDLADVTAGLLSWAREQGVAWQAHEEPRGTVWRARIEHYLTNPDEVPDPENPVTEVALLAAERSVA
jgi:effector-binding domain-containing protein